MIDRSKACDTPRDPAAIETVPLFGTRAAETILASGHVRPHKQAGHMIASDPTNTLPQLLQAGGRPHMGPGSVWRFAPLGRDDKFCCVPIRDGEFRAARN